MSDNPKNENTNPSAEECLDGAACSLVSESVMEAGIIELESVAFLNGKKEAQSYEVDEARSHLRKLIRKARRDSEVDQLRKDLKAASERLYKLARTNEDHIAASYFKRQSDSEENAKEQEL